MQVLARLGEVPGALPLADVLEPRPLGLGPSMDGRAAHGVEEVVARRAREGPEGHGRVGLAERRQPDLGQRLAERARRDGERVHVRRLALVGRHAGRGVALDVLDRAETLAHRELDVLGGDVVLEVHESLDAGRVAAVRQGAQRAAALARVVARHRMAAGPLRGIAGSPRPRGRALVERRREPPGARTGAGRGLHLRGVARQVSLRLGIEAQLAAGLREQVDGRREAARHQQEVAGHGLEVGRPRSRRLGHESAGHAQAAGRPHDRAARHHRQARGTRRRDALARGPRPRVDDAGDRHARVVQLERRPVGGVVRGHDHGAAAGPDTPAVQVAAGRVGQHHAGAVVVGKHQRALGRARRQHDMLRPDLPEPLARRARGHVRQMVGQALRQGDEVVVVVAEALRAGQQGRTAPGEFGQRRRDPVDGRQAVDHRLRLAQQGAAELRLLVAQDRAAPGAGRRERCREPRRAAAHDQHVAMGEPVGIRVGIGLLRRHAQARRAADHGLEQLGPERRALDEARTHEGLVVEARGEERRQEVVHGADVEAPRRPAVLARGDEALVELHLGHAQVRRLAGAVARHGAERVGLLGAGGQKAAGAVILEGAADEVHAVGEQRRGERVAVAALVGVAVEGEAERAGAVDAAAAGRAVEPGHGATSSPAPIRGASPSGTGGGTSGRASPDL